MTNDVIDNVIITAATTNDSTSDITPGHPVSQSNTSPPMKRTLEVDANNDDENACARCSKRRRIAKYFGESADIANVADDTSAANEANKSADDDSSDDDDHDDDSDGDAKENDNNDDDVDDENDDDVNDENDDVDDEKDDDTDTSSDAPSRPSGPSGISGYAYNPYTDFYSTIRFVVFMLTLSYFFVGLGFFLCPTSVSIYLDSINTGVQSNSFPSSSGPASYEYNDLRPFYYAARTPGFRFPPHVMRTVSCS